MGKGGIVVAITQVSIADKANSSRQVGFMIESEADVANLPTTTSTGQYKSTVDELSTAITNDGRIFVLGNDNRWHEW